MRRRMLLCGLAGLIVLISLSTTASAALWTSASSPWNCTSTSNSCVSSTGFNPNVSNWGQATNPRGNCTNYVAYRLIKNGGAKPAGLRGGAGAWAEKVRLALGASHVNSTPAVGAIAWWGPGRLGAGSPGHVAYVEKIVKGNVYLSDSSFGEGSSRYVVKAGDRKWPQAFLHIMDQPKKASAPVESAPPAEEEAPAPKSPPPTVKRIYHVHNTCADHSCGLLVETAPGSRFGGKVIGTLKDGTAVNVRCQTTGGMITGGEGSNDVWDQIDYGGSIGYVADLYLDTPGGETPQPHRHFTPSIPKC